MALAIAAGAVGLAVLPASADLSPLELVSRHANGAPAGDESTQPSISADGRIVAFTSKAKLTYDDAAAVEDVFVRDIETNATVLVSRASGAGGAPGDAQSYGPSISENGRYVAFESDAGNLGGPDAAGTDVFVRDLQSNSTTLVSRADGAGGPAGNGASHDPAISGDGRSIAFESAATNLAGPDANERDDIFVRVPGEGRTVRVSRNASGAAPDGNSAAAALSRDGRFVAFAARAPDMPGIGDSPARQWRIFRHDLVTGETLHISRASDGDGAGLGFDSYAPSITADGQRVAFESLAPNLHGEDVDLVNGSPIDDVFVHNVPAGTTTLVSRGPGEADGGDRHSMGAATSANGRYVVFETAATNLHDEDADNAIDVFVRDLDTGGLTFVSRIGDGGHGGAGHSLYPAVTAGGRFVAFESEATNLVDGAASPGVYRRDILGGPGTVDLAGPPSIALPPGAAPIPALTAPTTPIPPGVDRLAPTVRLIGVPRRCARRRFRLMVSVTDVSPLRRVALSIDRRQVARGHTRRLAVVIRPRRLRRGAHRLVVVASDVVGNRARKVKRFRVCRRTSRR